MNINLLDSLEAANFRRSNTQQEKLGILIGLLLTDGSVSKSGNSFQIEFTNKSENLHEVFKEEIRRLFQINNFTEISDSRYKEIKRTKLRNKKICETLLKIVSTFRTKQYDDGTFPESRIPEFFFELSDAEVQKIL